MTTFDDIELARIEIERDRLVDIWGIEVVQHTLQAGMALALTDMELWRIARLRYDLYVCRDQKDYEADHRSRLFCEPLDERSLNLYAVGKGQVSGALRLSRAADARRDEQLFRLLESVRTDESELAEIVTCSRLVLRPELSVRIAVVALFQDAYMLASRAGARTVLLATRSHLIGLFERFGFVRGGEAFADPVAGPLMPMSLDVYDFAHMASVHSPLLRSPGLHLPVPITAGAYEVERYGRA